MNRLHIIDDPFAESLKLAFRDVRTSVEQLRQIVRLLGTKIAEEIVRCNYLAEGEVQTPLGMTATGPTLAHEHVVIVSKREDGDWFSQGMADVLPLASLGWFDFAGARGPEARQRGPQALDLPRMSSLPVRRVVVAKAAIAGGCTVAEMAHRAVREYRAKELFIAGAFYTEVGLNEVWADFPYAEFYVIGKPDTLNSERLLVPGVGVLRDRLGVGTPAR